MVIALFIASRKDVILRVAIGQQKSRLNYLILFCTTEKTSSKRLITFQRKNREISGFVGRPGEEEKDVRPGELVVVNPGSTDCC